MTPEGFVLDAAGGLIQVIMLGALSMLGFALLKEITR